MDEVNKLFDFLDYPKFQTLLLRTLIKAKSQAIKIA